MLISGWLRAIIVLIIGIAISVVIPVFLEYLLQPNGAIVIRRALTAPLNDSQWHDIAKNLRHQANISVFVIAPATGLVVGLFVGFFQEHRAQVVAALCLLPDLCDSLLSDRRKLWASSFDGICRFVAFHSLPFILAVVAAFLVKAWMRRRTRKANELA